MKIRRWSVGLGLTLAVAACDGAKRERAVADSLTAVAVAADSASRAAVADSARRADSLAAIATSKGKGSTQTTSKPGTKSGAIIGRDSVIMNPKPIGLPTIADTAKRRPPS